MNELAAPYVLSERAVSRILEAHPEVLFRPGTDKALDWNQLVAWIGGLPQRSEN